MPIEFHRDPSSGETVKMYVDDIEIPGVFRAEETGKGITEKFKAERKQRSGGQDSVDEPPAAQIRVEAYVSQETYDALETKREESEPFEVQIGPFAFEEMGISNLEGRVRANEQNAIHLKLKLQEYRRYIIQERNLFDQGGSGSGGGTGLDDMDAEGPPAAWIDQNGDGRDDRTGERIPNVETIPLSPGQNWEHNVTSGESWGRRVLDSSAGNSFPTVTATGSNWAVQDIGIRGEVGSPGRNYAAFGFTGSGDCLVRNIYAGDGAPMYSGDRGSTAMHVQPETRGQLTFDHITVAGWPDNGIYASAPAGGAQILITDSYGLNNGHANFRLGRGRVQSSVSILDGGGHSSNGPRAIWAWPPGPVEIVDCDVIASGGSDWNAIVAGEDDYGGTVVNIRNSGLEGQQRTVAGSSINGSSTRQPDPENIVGTVPGSPMDAATGISGSGPDTGGGGGGTVQ